MELKKTVIRNTQYLAQDKYTLTGGKVVKLKVAGNDVFSEKCPAGYTWDVEVSVHITQHVAE